MFFRFIALILIAMGVAIWIGILREYRWYFPADFEQSGFLAGRRYRFDLFYRLSFYTHLVVGPLAILLAAFLWWSGQIQDRSTRLSKAHKRLGWTLFALVGLFLFPSGLAMSMSAYAGTISQAGFAVLALATFGCIAMAVVQVRRRRIDSHRRWAIRGMMLLFSPLLFRLVAMGLRVFEMETALTYQVNAWASWLIPLSIAETVMRLSSNQPPSLSNHRSPLDSPSLRNDFRISSLFFQRCNDAISKMFQRRYDP